MPLAKIVDQELGPGFMELLQGAGEGFVGGQMKALGDLERQALRGNAVKSGKLQVTGRKVRLAQLQGAEIDGNIVQPLEQVPVLGHKAEDRFVYGLPQL